MRKLFKTLFAALCLTLAFNFGDVLIGSLNFLEEPRIHVVQEGENFSQLAEKYYGNAGYWRALALINRAPNVNKIYPGEHIILPDVEAVAKIAGAKRLSEVNELVSNQEAMARLESEIESDGFVTTQTITPAESGQEVEKETALLETEIAEQPVESLQEVDEADFELISQTSEQGALTASDAKSPGWVWPVAGVSAFLVAGIGLFYYRRRKDEVNAVDSDKEIDASPVTSFILDGENFERTGRKSNSKSLPSFSDEVFKPVRRKHNELKDQEVML